VKNEDASSIAGSPSPGQGQEGFLILKYPGPLRQAQSGRFMQDAEQLAASMGLKAIVLTDGMDATVIPAGISELVQEMRTQSAALNRLAASNEALIQAMIESEGMDEDLPPRTYLNGKPTL